MSAKRLFAANYFFTRRNSGNPGQSFWIRVSVSVRTNYHPHQEGCSDVLADFQTCEKRRSATFPIVSNSAVASEPGFGNKPVHWSTDNFCAVWGQQRQLLCSVGATYSGFVLMLSHDTRFLCKCMRKKKNFVQKEEANQTFCANGRLPAAESDTCLYFAHCRTTICSIKRKWLLVSMPRPNFSSNLTQNNCC